MTVTTTGEVFTRRWVVDLMLDLAGYTGDVSALRVVEPSIGSGAFVGPMVRRLATSGARWESMFDALRGYDLRAEHVMTCRKLATSILTSAGCPMADELVNTWFHTGDFLLSDVPAADLVIGNPPYIRMENLDPELLATYRRRCPTMGGRADIFVGFFERGLDLSDLVVDCCSSAQTDGCAMVMEKACARISYAISASMTSSSCMTQTRSTTRSAPIPRS